MRRKTDEEFKEELKEVKGEEYRLLGEYVTAKTKLRVEHLPCGNVWEVRPNNLLRYKGCPMCSGKKKKSTEEFSEEMRSLVGGEYVLIGEYDGRRVPIEMKHMKDGCGKIFKMTPGNFLTGQRCPRCRKSKGERRISEILSELGVKYETQYPIGKGNYGRPLRTDFYLPEYHSVIEYDGEQHFRSIEYWGGDEAYDGILERDEAKYNFCLDEGISIFKISYKDFDILDEVVKKYIDEI